MPQHNQTPPTFLEWLGFNRQPDFTKARPLGAVVGMVLKLIAAALCLGFCLTLIDFIRAGLRIGPFENDTTGESIRNIGLVLVALLGGPFLVWRSYVAAQQANTAKEALFNDKINAAATDLAARRQVTRIVCNSDGNEAILTEWQDDLVTRTAAIDRLEGLAREQTDNAPRIARQLSIYVKELSRQHPPDEPPQDASLSEVLEWADNLTPARTDMEKAAQTLGRLQTIVTASLSSSDIDLRGANLQGFNLANLHFECVRFEAASMQGVLLSRTRMERASFAGARMQGATLSGAHLQMARLDSAQMQGARLSETQMQGAVLAKTELQEATLFLTNMRGVYLDGTKLDESTFIESAFLAGAGLTDLDYVTTQTLRPFWKSVFADGSVYLPQEETRPKHWTDKSLLWNFEQEWRKWQATLPPE